MAYDEYEQLQDGLERLELGAGAVYQQASWGAHNPPSPPRSYPASLGHDGTTPQQRQTSHVQRSYVQQGGLYPRDSLAVHGSPPGGQTSASAGNISSTGVLTSLSQSPPQTRDIPAGAGGSSPPAGVPNSTSSQARIQDIQRYDRISDGGGMVSGTSSAVPTTGAGLHGLFGLGSEWEPVVAVGTNQPQLDFTGFLGQLSAGESDYSAPTQSRGMQPSGWGGAPPGGPPVTGLQLSGPSLPHAGHTGNGQTLHCSSGFDDWRVPGSARRPEQELAYQRQAQGPGGDAPVLFHDNGYRGRQDSGQVCREREVWSNGNISSGLDALAQESVFWAGSTAAQNIPARSQPHPINQSHHMYSQRRGELQSHSALQPQMPLSQQPLGHSPPATFVPQYSQSTQPSAQTQQSRSQRSKREHRRSNGGGARGNGRAYAGQPTRSSNRRSAPVAPPRPPSWADADWHPMKAVASAKVGQSAGGTGVFLPGAPKSAQPDNQRNRPLASREKSRGNGEYMRPQSRGTLPEEWVY